MIKGRRTARGVAYPPGLLSRRVTARGRSITLGPASCDRNPSDPLQIVWRHRLVVVTPAFLFKQGSCQIFLVVNPLFFARFSGDCSDALENMREKRAPERRVAPL
ncbi:hypothetical protein BN135_2313 [Cronobacter muytjensii 530]